MKTITKCESKHRKAWLLLSLVCSTVHTMKTSIILSSAFSILTLTLVSCATGPGTDTTRTKRQATESAFLGANSMAPRPVTDLQALAIGAN